MSGANSKPVATAMHMRTFGLITAITFLVMVCIVNLYKHEKNEVLSVRRFATLMEECGAVKIFASGWMKRSKDRKVTGHGGLNHACTGIQAYTRNRAFHSFQDSRLDRVACVLEDLSREGKI